MWGKGRHRPLHAVLFLALLQGGLLRHPVAHAPQGYEGILYRIASLLVVAENALRQPYQHGAQLHDQWGESGFFHTPITTKSGKRYASRLCFSV